MTRINLLLLLAVLASAMYLVTVQYQSRLLFTELDRARTEAHRLEVEHDSLQVSKRAQATPARVERLAQDKLQMRQAAPSITAYVSYASATPAAAPAQIAAAGTLAGASAAKRGLP